MKLIALGLCVGCAVACGGRIDTNPNPSSAPSADANTNLTTVPLDAGDADTSACPAPSLGCHGCNPLGLTGSWCASQLQDCKLTFTVAAPLAVEPQVNLVIDGSSEGLDVADAGLVTWESSPPYNKADAGASTFVDFTLTLRSDVCDDVVKAYAGARIDVYALLCSIPVTCHL